MLSTFIQTVRRLLPVHRQPVRRSWIDECVLGAILLALGIFFVQITFVVSNVRYQFDDRPFVTDQLPLSFGSQAPAAKLTVVFHVHAGEWLRPSTYTVRADDCLSDMTVNGVPLDKTLIEPCIIDRPKEMALGQFIKPGDNVIIATVPDGGGRQSFSFEPSKTDPLVLFVRIAILLLITFLGTLIAFRAESKTRRAFFLIILLGVLLRLAYFSVTPFNVRSNDGEGHVDYIVEVSKHWHVPPLHGGWEFYQPPLYYFVSAVQFAALRHLDLPMAMILRFMQFFGVLCSFGLLAICAWMADKLFSEHQRVEKLLWIGIFAVFPGLLLMASKINNDVLVQLLCFGAAALAISFWQTGSSRSWYGLILAITLGILTKVNAAPMLGVALLVLVCHPSVPWRRKLILGAVGTFIVLSFNEWLLVLRAMEDPNAGMVGNIGNLHGGLIVSNRVRDYLIFNPLGVLHHPYNNAWIDEMRRMYFFEYFFRSAFFGEFDWGSTLRRFAQIVLSTGFVCGILLLIGMVMGRKEDWRKALPMWFLFFAVLAGHLLFRMKYPYGPSQDFRYSAQILLPVAYFVVLAPSKLPRKLGWCAYAFIALSLVLYVGYMICLIVINPL